jgi:hypothetical protein
VMNVLEGLKVASEHILHDQDVFEHVWPFLRTRMCRGMDHDVPGFVDDLASLPGTVVRAAMLSAGGAVF